MIFKKNYISLIFFSGLLIIIFSVNLYSQNVNIEKEDMCFNCHAILEDTLKAPADLYKEDIHFLRGVTCSSCHGGNYKTDDIDISMNKSEGFIGVPKGRQIAIVCSKCHGEQFKKFSKSVHGIITPGKAPVIVSCIDCHGIHNISKVNSPGSKMKGANIIKTCTGCHSNSVVMKKYNPDLPVNQLENYKKSVHGQKLFKGDKNVPTCVSCHSNHDIVKVKDEKSPVNQANVMMTCIKCHSDKNYMKGYNIPADQFEKYKTSVHGIAYLEKGNTKAPLCTSCHGSHGATPPDVETITKVCGSCHVLNAQMFEKSPHYKAFKEKGINQCSECHNHHDIGHPTDEMIGVGEKSVCIKCHKDDKGAEFAVYVNKMIDSLNREVEEVNMSIGFAEMKGMNIGDSKIDDNEIRQVLITSRTSLHYSDPEIFKNKIDSGFKIAEKSKEIARNAHREYYNRRIIPGLSAVFISFIVFSLFFKIRNLKKNNS